MVTGGDNNLKFYVQAIWTYRSFVVRPTSCFKCKANASTISKDTWGQLNPMQPSPQCGAGKTIQIQ